MSAYAFDPFTPSGGGGLSDYSAFAFPPNSRSSSLCDAPIIDPDFTYIDAFGSGSYHFQRDPVEAAQFERSQPPPWYTDEEATAEARAYQTQLQLQQLPQHPSPPPPPPPPHPHLSHTPAHGLAPIIPPGGSRHPVSAPHREQGKGREERGVVEEVGYSSLPPPAFAYPQAPSHSFATHPSYPVAPPTAAYNGQSAAARPPLSQQQQQLVQAFSQRGYAAPALPPPQQSPQPGYSTTASPSPSYHAASDVHSPVSQVSSSSSSHSSQSSSVVAVNGHPSSKRRPSQETAPSPPDADADAHAADDDGAGQRAKGRGAKKAKTETAKKPPIGARGRKKSGSTPSVGPEADGAHAIVSPSGQSSTPADNAPVSWWLERGKAPVDPKENCWFDPNRNGHYWVSSNALQYATLTFKNVITSCNMITPSNTTDIICFLAHVMEVLPEFALTNFIKQLGFVPYPLPSVDGEAQRVMWRSAKEYLPYITLPHRFRLNWSRSPENTTVEDPSVINFPTLMWWREREMQFVKKMDFIAAQPIDGPGRTRSQSMSQFPNESAAPPVNSPLVTSKEGEVKEERDGGQPSTPVLSPVPMSSTTSTPSVDTPSITSSTSLQSPPPLPSSPSDSPTSVSSFPALPSGATLSPSQVDMSLLDLPCHVEVNSAFERMFGYSQSEVKAMFMRYGKQAMARLADPKQLRRVHEQDVQGMCEGQNEFTHVIDIHTKYGSGMRTIMHHKLVVNESGMVFKKLYLWLPAPAGLTKLLDTANANSNGVNGS